MAEPGSTEIISAGGLSQIVGAETDIQIATARKYPRVIEKFDLAVRTQVVTDLDTAISMAFHLEREDRKTQEVKEIIGESVRFAEIVALAWGNMRVGASITDISEEFVTARGQAWDLENNFAQFRERKASIRTRQGHKFSQDMIKTVSNAAASIAYRESILKTIPKALWKKHWDYSQQFILEANGAKLNDTRDRALKYFTKRGATIEQILAKLGVSEVDAIKGEHLQILGALYTAVHDEGQKISEVFVTGEAKAEDAAADKASEVLNEMKNRAAVSAGTTEKTADAPMA